jgi:hypothetical protein
MNVIGHQAIADQFCPVSLDALLQQGEIDAALSITFKDEAPRIGSLPSPYLVCFAKTWTQARGEAGRLSGDVLVRRVAEHLRNSV